MKRSFNGAKHVYSNDNHIGGLYGFIMKLRWLIKTYNINKVIVFWDGDNGGKLRYDVYPHYKANRESKDWYSKITLTSKEASKQEEEQSYLWQITRVRQYLEEIFCRQIQVSQIESDDLIAYYCKKYSDSENIIIYTNDRDLCQLLNYDNVSVYIDNKKLLITKDSYYVLFKHHYKNLCLIKTLCGDTSDNIKGIEGLGEKTLFKYFPEINEKEITLQHILDKTNLLLESKKQPVVLKNIVEGKFLDLGVVGQQQLETNEYIINLLNPILTKEAMSELAIVSEQPLDDTDRGSKNLLRLFTEDQILSHYTYSFNDFCRPFFPVILREKDFLKKNTI
jgi:5'-3' exonuclease